MAACQLSSRSHVASSNKAFIIASLVAITFAGCAAPRSNTRRFKEETKLIVATELQGAKPQPHGGTEQSLISSAVVPELAVKALIYVGKKLTAIEAAKYQAEFSADAVAVMDTGFKPDVHDPSMHSWVINKSAAILFLRTIEEEHYTDVKHPLIDLSNDEQRSDFIQTSCNSFSKRIDPSSIKTLRRVLDKQVPTNGLTTFAAALMIEPSWQVSTNLPQPTMDITLCGYVYPAYKAKQSRISIPLLAWKNVESLLALGIEGPAGQSDYPESQYRINAVFALQKPEAAATSWVTAAAKHFAGPFAVPRSHVITTKAKLIESSKMKESLEQLAKQIGGLTPKDLGLKKDEK